MPRSLAVARLWYEANSFTPVPARIAQFKAREWVAGDAVPPFYRGTRTELGAAIDFVAARPDWTATWLRCAAASPGGPVAEDDLQAMFREIVDGVAATGADAVYLSLHGALIGERTLAADLELITRVRKAIGTRPLVVTFDLHANVAPEIAPLVDVLVGYKTYPHVDMYETAERALGLLDRTLSGEIRPVVAIRKVGAILPSFNMRTESGPMAEIEALARAAMAENATLLDVTPFGGFAYGDTPCAGASVTAVANVSAPLADTTATRIAGEMLARADRFRVTLPAARQAVATALQRIVTRTSARPVAIVEPSDNPLSGGAGDCPGLLQAVVHHAASVEAVFAFFWDPALVGRCHALGTGHRIAVTFGARLSRDWGAPVHLVADIEKLTDGRFRNVGPMEAGLAVDLGRTVVLRSGKLRVIVTEACHAPNDIAYFTLHDIDLAGVDLVAAKAKNHFRAAFTPLCDAILEAETPGPAMADMTKLPFSEISDPLAKSIGIRKRARRRPAPAPATRA
jgi:microcystin degradation protein MlrC